MDQEPGCGGAEPVSEAIECVICDSEVLWVICRHHVPGSEVITPLQGLRGESTVMSSWEMPDLGINGIRGCSHSALGT